MKIAAFNAKNLGQKKVTDQTVVGHLVKIMSRYSVVVILEVMDKSGEAMDKLLQDLNTSSSNRTHRYSMIASRQLGRDKYKEQFVCFYREADVTLEASHQYEDNQAGDEDAFAREPFILRFSCPAAAVKDLVLIPVHTKPDDSQKELDELHDVVEAVRRRWRTDNIMILGDFNADGRYLSKRKKDTIRICSAAYHWLIEDDVDTTSSNFNDHTYDRIVVFGQTLLNAIVPGSAKSFNFQKEFKLTDEETLDVSDHYPVEVELKTDHKYKAPRQRTTALPRTTNSTSTTRQAHRKGPQKKKKNKGQKAEGPQKKKKNNKGQKAEGSQKNKKTATGRKRRQRQQKSDTPAKRQRLVKC